MRAISCIDTAARGRFPQKNPTHAQILTTRSVLQSRTYFTAISGCRYARYDEKTGNVNEVIKFFIYYLFIIYLFIIYCRLKYF